MDYGLFMMPSHPPERGIFEAHQWDLDCLVQADELGYNEAWIGEHFTSPWEPIPSPDIMIAQALMRTKNIRLGAGAHLLPFHHPAELAHRVAYMDHLSQGRLMFGVGASGLPTDWAMFDVDGANGQHREMTQEALEIILKMWEDKGPFQYKGKYWNVEKPEPMFGTLEFFLKPYQQPHPPIGIASLSYKSPSLIMAGERGFIPLTLAFNPDYVRSHWDAVEEGAKKSGKTPSRKDWRICRDVYVADTDEEAKEAVLNGMTGRVWRDYLFPLFKEFDLVPIFKHDPEVPDEAVDIEYLADHIWLMGSPETVSNKIRTLYNDVGGFGNLTTLVFDQSENQKGWDKSMRLMAEEVIPSLSDLVPA